MKLWKRVVLPVALLASGVANGSALVVKSDLNGTLDFHTQLNFSGPAASAQVAYEASTEIARLWNESRAQVFYRMRYYRVRFYISYQFKAQRDHDSGSCAENFVVVERGDPRIDRSFFKLSGRTGTLYLSDAPGRSTTAAHEFGHGLGLGHDDLEQFFAPVPGIMFPRGTFVQARFQWNPRAIPGEPGGSLNPAHRKVRLVDVQRLDLADLDFSGGIACLGAGRPIPLLSFLSLPLHPPAPNPVPRILLEGVYSPDVEHERLLERFDH